MAVYTKAIVTVFVLLVASSKINAEPSVDPIQQIGNTLLRFLNPFELSKEAIQVAGGMINAGTGNTKTEQFYVPSGNSQGIKSEENAGGEDYGIEVLCNGKQHDYDCRGPDWDLESENTFKYGINDLQYLTQDVHGVVPADIQWVPNGPCLPPNCIPQVPAPAPCVGPYCATQTQIVCEGPSCGSGFKKELIAGAVQGIAAGAAAGFALPIAFMAAKIAKPFAWKLAIAAKIAFLKLLFLKKLFLIGAKIGAIKLIKGAFIAFPFLIVPILKSLGFFKLIRVALGGVLKHLDCMLRRFGPCENNLTYEESLTLHVLPWFAQHREVVNNDGNIFRMPTEIVENFVNPSDIVGNDFMRNLPKIGLTPETFAEIGQVLAGNVSNVASLLKPNMRRLQENAAEAIPSYEEATQLQQVIQEVVSDLLGGFSSALHSYQEVRKEYNEFTEFSKQENPGLMERSMKQEMEYRLKVPQSVERVLDTDVSLLANDSTAVQRASIDVPSMEDIDSAFRGLANSIQGRTQLVKEE